MSVGGVIWITGLSGSGKSTTAGRVVDVLRSRGLQVIQLDGDELRGVFGEDGYLAQNHGSEARFSLAFKYSRLCKYLGDQGQLVVIATISLYHEIHLWNRENILNYFEVFLDIDQEELRRRDPKQIYSRFDAGDLVNVVGLDLPFDEPVDAQLRLTEEGRTPSQVAELIIAEFDKAEHFKH